MLAMLQLDVSRRSKPLGLHRRLRNFGLAEERLRISNYIAARLYVDSCGGMVCQNYAILHNTHTIIPSSTSLRVLLVML
jgi:hypothetical protein